MPLTPGNMLPNDQVSSNQSGRAKQEANAVLVDLGDVIGNPAARSVVDAVRILAVQPNRLVAGRDKVLVTYLQPQFDKFLLELVPSPRLDVLVAKEVSHSGSVLVMSQGPARM